MAITSNFWSAYVGYMSRIRERRAHQRTVEEVANLPEHLRRDIGWPNAYENAAVVTEATDAMQIMTGRRPAAGLSSFLDPAA